MVDKFKAEVGRVIMIGAIAYCGLLTIGLMVSAIWKCELSQPVRDMLVIILTWITTKAGTVVDHQYGGSAGSDAKTAFLMKEVKDEKQETITGMPKPDSAPDNPGLPGVRRESDSNPGESRSPGATG
jgi:hypothetical protein